MAACRPSVLFCFACNSKVQRGAANVWHSYWDKSPANHLGKYFAVTKYIQTFRFPLTSKHASSDARVKSSTSTRKMAIQSKLSWLHVWHSSSTTVQCSHIRRANDTQLKRLAAFRRHRAVYWKAMWRAPRDLQGRAESLRQDWSERPWRTSRWHTRRIKKSRFIHR